MIKIRVKQTVDDEKASWLYTVSSLPKLPFVIMAGKINVIPNNKFEFDVSCDKLNVQLSQLNKAESKGEPIDFVIKDIDSEYLVSATVRSVIGCNSIYSIDNCYAVMIQILTATLIEKES